MTKVTIVTSEFYVGKRIAAAVSDMMVDQGFSFQRAKASKVADGRSIELQFSEMSPKEPSGEGD